jgi:hypothetical protein
MKKVYIWLAVCRCATAMQEKENRRKEVTRNLCVFKCLESSLNKQQQISRILNGEGDKHWSTRCWAIIERRGRVEEKNKNGWHKSRAECRESERFSVDEWRCTDGRLEIWYHRHWATTMRREEKRFFLSRILFISVIIEKEIVCTSESRWTTIIIKSPSYSMSSDNDMTCERKRASEKVLVRLTFLLQTKCNAWKVIKVCWSVMNSLTM